MDPIQKNVAASLAALTNQYEATTSNLANASTIGYKRRVTAFQQELDRRMQPPVPGELAESKVTSLTRLDFRQGGLSQSTNPLDLAIMGEGFFTIETTDGPVYTRNGCFRTNATNQLVDSNGHLVAGEGGPITIPSGVSTNDVKIGSDGTVSANGASVGRIKLVTFKDTSKLIALGMGSYKAPMGISPSDAPKSQIAQGYRESSNVNVVEELVNMITVTRLYESGLKTIHTEDERLKNLLQVATTA